uniref:Uncharacterized protein n=1 Tax=uncultured marine virus TaxID=186617 RepID=A0A0F7L6S5_9VIRU|nr:hypothetical protein [uncultured marine virus]
MADGESALSQTLAPPIAPVRARLVIVGYRPKTSGLVFVLIAPVRAALATSLPFA